MNGGAGACCGAQGGEGGKAGADGQVKLKGQTEGIVSLNTDGQIILTWSWIHNQTVNDFIVRSGEGGGKGGEGGDFTGCGGGEGGDGGDGGNGDDAAGDFELTQTSGANVAADLDWGPDADGCTPTGTVAGVEVDIGWNSTGDLAVSEGNVWNRTTDFTIAWGETTLNITGGPTGSISAAGVFSDESLYFESSADSLQDATGTFYIDPEDFWDEIFVNDTVTITTVQNAVSSTIRADGEQFGGLGATNYGIASDGGMGGAGGDGAAGGADGDDGGDGAGAQSFDGGEQGIFQGVVAIIVSN
jgi:hypothetical protein